MADFEDLFTGTLDTNLTDHTPNVGTAWTGGGTTTDNARLTGNGELKAESNESLHAIFADDLGSPDHQVWAKFMPNAASPNARLCVRLGSTDDYGGGIARADGEVSLTSRSGGSTNEYTRVSNATMGITNSDPVWLRVKCSGDTITWWYSTTEPTNPEADTNWTQLDVSRTNAGSNTIQTPGMLLFGSSVGGTSTDADPWLDSYYASTLSTDTTAPTLTNATSSANGSDGYSGSVDTDEGNGTLYHVVDQSATAPTKAEVKVGNGSDGTAADTSGNQAVSATGTQNVGQTGVLAASTTYYIHYMHEDSSGNQSTVATTTSFTTDAADTTAPTLSSATVDGTALTLTYNESLDEASVPATGDFTVTGSSSGTVSVSNVGVSGTDVNLTLSSAVAVGETVDLDYTPGTNPIQDTAGNDAASLTDEPVTNNTTDDLTLITNNDSQNITVAETTITNPGTTTPLVEAEVREQGGQWRYFYFGLSSALNKRPTIRVDFSEHFGNTNIDGTKRPWYTYDNPETTNPTWNRWDSDMTNVSASTWEFQLSTAFTQDTVYIASEPAYPVARAKALIDWYVANHPTLIHRLPSVGDDANWSAGTVSSQTDGDGNTVPSQPMYAFGVWDSVNYPSDVYPKRTVVITSGHHSGEVGGNHVCEAFVKFLASADAEAMELRKNFQFLVYPMLNPDGRYGGGARESWENTSIDPNRDMINQTLEMTQVFVAAFDKDFDGRTVPFHASFHSDQKATSDSGGGTENMFFFRKDTQGSAYRTAWGNAVALEGDYGFEDSSITDGLRAYMEDNYGTVHSYVPEHMPLAPGFTSYSTLVDNGEDTARALDNLWNAEQSGQLAYAGNYIAETLNGSATVSRQLDAAVYPWPPKPADTPVKVERGLGADSSRAFRMDLGGTTGDVFVVLSSVDYESVNSDAAAGANKVTVSTA